MFYQLMKKILTLQMFCHLKIVGLLLNQCEYLITKYVLKYYFLIFFFRCRVLYLGSAVPHVTKDGLQGIQEPLKELYPEDGALGAKGIDSWLSVWSNGFLLENMDENRKKVSRFFPIESLHYCAAVRYVLVPGSANGTNGTSSNNNTLNRSASGAAADKSAQPRFLPLDSPFARNPNINHPPLFAAILRRTTGIKVLECHVFICKRETAANALVR